MIAPGFDELIRLEIRVNENANCVNGQSFNWSPLRPTVAYLHGVPIGLAIVEVSENRAMRYIGDGSFIPEKQYRPDLHFGPTWTVEKSQPTGKIKLIGYSPFPQFPWLQEWKESSGALLGSNIDKIVSVLESRAMTLASQLEYANRYFEPP